MELNYSFHAATNLGRHSNKRRQRQDQTASRFADWSFGQDSDMALGNGDTSLISTSNNLLRRRHCWRHRLSWTPRSTSARPASLRRDLHFDPHPLRSTRGVVYYPRSGLAGSGQKQKNGASSLDPQHMSAQGPVMGKATIRWPLTDSICRIMPSFTAPHMIYTMSVYGAANILRGSHFLGLAKHHHCCDTWPESLMGEPNTHPQPRIMTPKGATVAI